MKETAAPHGTPKSQQYPMDYPVPNFGQDHDIADSLKHMEDQEKKHGKWELPTFVQVDAESAPACDSYSCKTETAAPHKLPKAQQYAMNFPVPDFGEDHEITAAKANLNAMEEKYGKWDYPGPKSKGPPRNYFVPDFGVDEDIKASIKNLNSEERIHGEWKLPAEENVMLSRRSMGDNV